MSEADRAADFLQRGWCRFEFDRVLLQWVNEILPAAQASVSAPENAEWLRCGDTWFIGVHALPNAVDGSVAGGAPLAGRAVDFIRRELGFPVLEWDRAQVSVVYPGYPKRVPSESESAFRYRRERDAAHVDGVLREGAGRRRFLRNHHDFILGIPLVEVSSGTSPFVVWERSHELVRAALQARFADVPPAQWPKEDITDLYHAIRQRVFESCTRIEVTAKPGEAYLVHRHALHGIAPWTKPDSDGAAARMIVYFRPESRSPAAWLTAA